MRSDMQKVIVERPRWGSRRKSLKTAQRLDPRRVVDDLDFDSGPNRAPASRHEKHFNEHLQPLWRFLRSNLGRPWSKVHSEIRSRLDSRSVLGSHVLDHLDWEVATRCFLDGKQVMARSYGAAHAVQGFYVHPKTGSLLEAPRPSWKRRRSNKTYEVSFVRHDDGRTFKRIQNLWFETFYRPVEGQPKPELIAKRQCSAKQIREIDRWIHNADRGRRGYSRGAASIRVPVRPLLVHCAAA